MSLGRVGANRGRAHRLLAGAVTGRWVPLLDEQTLSERKAAGLSGTVVLHCRNKVQWNVRVFIDRRDFNAAHDGKWSLTQSDRLLCLCQSHSRVVRCDFIES
ncbi:hypothetical protein EMIT0P294_210031 [Pseudomonas sp. IT-P294]